MKKKNIISFLVVCIVVFSICGCGKTNEPTTNETENQEVEEIDETELLLESAKDIVDHGWWIDLVYDEGSLEKYNIGLKEMTDNAYAKEVNRLYEELDIENKSDFEKDFLDFYCQSKFRMKNEFDFDNITKVWKIGYDEDDNAINGSDNLYYRKIVSQVDSNNYYSFSIFQFYYKGVDQGIYRMLGGASSKNIGFGEDEKKGIWYPEVADDEIIGATYELVEEGEIEKILSDNQELLSLLDACYEKVMCAKTTKKQEDNKPKEPAIGMTKSEVLNGTWGEPDKKNIDEYEWGTEEQWVYDGKGYVYFENGVVTSIQHR